MLLTFQKIVRQEFCRSNKDKRVFITKFILEYKGEDNNEYRKSIEVKQLQEPVIIQQGTHEQLNKFQYQW